MATLIYCTGYEHGLETPVVSGSGLIDGIVGTVQVQSTVKRSGEYALYFNATSAAAYVYKNVAFRTYADYVIRVYIYITGTPTSGRNFLISETSAYDKFTMSFGDGRALKAQVKDGTVITGAAITADAWHRLDLHFYVGSTTGTIDWAIDGSAQTQATGTVTAGTFADIRLGDQYNALGVDLYVDDIAVSGTSGDYPLGVSASVGLRPTADGTNVPGTDTMELVDGTDISAGAPAYAMLDDNPWTSTANADLVKQSTIGTGNYAEVTFADTTKTTINGVQAILQYAGSGANANTGGCIIIDEDTTETAVWGKTGALTDYSEVTAFYKSVQLPTPAGGWDTAAVNALKARIGYSGDVTDNPYWLAIMLEVDGSGEVSGGPDPFNLYMI